MQLAFQIGAYLVGLPLEVAILVILLRGPWKRYPFVFLYLIGDFLTTVLEMEPSLGYGTGSVAEKHAFAKLYWVNERIIQVLLLLMVMGLVYRATANIQPRRTLLLLVIGGTLLIAGITFVLCYDPSGLPGKWMGPWTRDLNFLAAVLDFGLWAALIGARKKDYKLLLISGALGIQFAAGAIGQSLKQMSDSQMLSTMSGDLISLASTTCLYIWWHAFRLPDSIPAQTIRTTQRSLG